MCLDVGAVYADVLQVGVLAQFMEDLLDQAAFRPLLEPLVHRLPRAVPLRQVAPGCSASGNPEDAVQHLPGFTLRTSLVAHLSLWKIGLQPLPFGVCQFVPSNNSLHVAHLMGYIRHRPPVFLLVFLHICIFLRFSLGFMLLETHSRVIMPMYASPSAAVMTPAVPAEITPPATDPIPGISLTMLATTVLPSNVAPPAPSVAERNAVKILLLTSNPKITVIDTIIVSCVGISNAQSEKGMGTAPAPAAAAVAVAIAACASRFFSAKLAI